MNKKIELKIKEIKAKSILQKSGLPDADWVINPYTGCRFGCKYCYAAFVGKFNHLNQEWGSYLDIKTNAPEILKQELSSKLKKQEDIGTIFLSSVTDPYQGVEAKYKLTKKCLDVLLAFNYQGKISILTKSSLVTRDIPLFKQFKNIEIGLTITSTQDPISNYLETFATPADERINTIKTLTKNKINTYAFVGPLLPHFVWQIKALEKLLFKIKKAGAQYIYIEHLNLNPAIKSRLLTFLKEDYRDLIDQFEESTKPEYREKLEKLIHKIRKKINLPLAHDQVIYHQNEKSWTNLAKSSKR